MMLHSVVSSPKTYYRDLKHRLTFGCNDSGNHVM